MSKLSSVELSTIQALINKAIKEHLSEPMIDFNTIRELVETMEKVDSERRETWNDEKFGTYDEISRQVFDRDDIPF